MCVHLKIGIKWISNDYPLGRIRVIQLVLYKYYFICRAINNCLTIDLHVSAHYWQYCIKLNHFCIFNAEKIITPVLWLNYCTLICIIKERVQCARGKLSNSCWVFSIIFYLILRLNFFIIWIRRVIRMLTDVIWFLERIFN